MNEFVITSDYFVLEIGYNGCDISDIKTQIKVSVVDAAWLAGIIYDGLEKNGYGGRFVNIVGQHKFSVSLNSSTAEDNETGAWVDESIKSLSPFKPDV